MARRLRREMSPPETILWQRVRGKKLGFKFRRQHPVGPYVVDFCCAGSKLIVEIDGLAHDNAARAMRDEGRERFFVESGYKVLRVTAAEVFDDVGRVLTAIVAQAESPLHQPAAGPPPRAGEDSR